MLGFSVVGLKDVGAEVVGSLLGIAVLGMTDVGKLGIAAVGVEVDGADVLGDKLGLAVFKVLRLMNMLGLKVIGLEIVGAVLGNVPVVGVVGSSGLLVGVNVVGDLLGLAD